MKQENRVKGLNRYGIQDDSTLKVDINLAVFPRVPNMATLGSVTDRASQYGPQAFYVKVRIDNLQRQEDQTQHQFALGSNGISPRQDGPVVSDVDSNPGENVVHFQESFQFNVQTGQEQVTLALMAREEVGSPQVIGYAKFKLRPEYEDQLVHTEEWYNLEKGGQVIGRICLKIQWIYDQLLFLQKALQTHEESIKMFDE